MKRLVLVVCILLGLPIYGQQLEGIYLYKPGYTPEDTISNTLILLSGTRYKAIAKNRVFKQHYSDTPTIEIVQESREGQYHFKQNVITLDSMWYGFDHKIYISSVTDSGFSGVYIEGPPVFFRKLSMTRKDFDSIYKKHIAPPLRFPDYLWMYKPSKKLVLYNLTNSKTKTISQHNLSFSRIYMDTLLGKTDTMLQYINGFIESISSDSMVHIRASSYHINNHYSLAGDYLWDWDKPEIDIMTYKDTVLVFPLHQLQRIYGNLTNSGEGLGIGLLVTGGVNALATPFYSIDYKDYTVNKPLFKTSILASLAVMAAGIAELIIIPKPKQYRTRTSPCKCDIWIIRELVDE